MAAACGGDDGGAEETTTVPTTAPRTAVPHTTTAAATTDAPTTTAVTARFPLTGLPATDPALLARPALAVKIDNHRDARPQAGINQADVVYEEIVEGITRFFAVFQSTDAAPV